MLRDKDFIRMVSDDDIDTRDIFTHIEKNMSNFEYDDFFYFVKNSKINPYKLGNTSFGFERHINHIIKKNNLLHDYISKLSCENLEQAVSGYPGQKNFRLLFTDISQEDIKRYLNPIDKRGQIIIESIFTTKLLLSDSHSVDDNIKNQAKEDAFFIFKNSDYIRSCFYGNHLSTSTSFYKFEFEFLDNESIKFKDKKLDINEMIIMDNATGGSVSLMSMVIGAFGNDEKKLNDIIKNSNGFIDSYSKQYILQILVYNDFKISEENFLYLTKNHKFTNALISFNPIDFNSVRKRISRYSPKTSEYKWNYAQISTYRWLPIKYIKSNLRKLKPFLIYSYLDESLIPDFLKITNFKKKNPIDYFTSMVTEKFSIYQPPKAFDPTDKRFYGCTKAEEDLTTFLCQNCVNKHMKKLTPSICAKEGLKFNWIDEIKSISIT